ncbi:hypothetical protein [Streptosporangium carneum]|uniref:Uncharacterized protein n=1 Tax=Streptosporangium carneum TaxID=47481 RepID=A0A9W6I984_9ACTN|nr:hypothetical protein [Streptosporangium carneum]GLK13523.1 hypothetical protein GCM10017600_69340 [Streptosporangium carneum]
MNSERGNVAGFRLTGVSRTGELGVWSSAVAPDGRPAGVLGFDPRSIADPAARDRLVAAVVADRGLIQAGLTGLVPISDLVSTQGEVWLLTAVPASPTLADLLSSGVPRPDAGGLAAVLLETAQTLLTLHAAGLAHGAVRPDTVVIAADGAALLAERGLADALHGRPSLPEGDVAAWASLARDLAASPAASPDTAGLFERAAATASAGGLIQARDALLAGRDLLPQGSFGRDGLAEAARRESSSAATPQTRQDRQAAAQAAALPGPDEGEIVTLLHVPRTGESRAGNAGQGTGTADTAPPESGGNVVMRFGPGVPAETTAAQIWRAGRDQQQTEPPSGRLRALGVPARRRRRRTALASAILALMVVGILAAWLLRGAATPLAVTGVETTAPKKTQGCDATVRITGVFATNGSAGQIRYQWKRSDRKAPIVQEDTVSSGQTSHEVDLQWTVKGEGRFRGTATLKLLSPLPADGKVQDKASFTYKCP